MDSGTYQPIIPNCMPSSYPSGRVSLITLRTALSAARRSAGSAARYWATVQAVMLATIPAELCGGQALCTASRSRPASTRVWSRSAIRKGLLSGHESAFGIRQSASLLQGASGQDAAFEGDPAGVCGQDAERNG